ncbi:dnaJ homolog subfamily C member 15 [Arvicola amphibius]|uniref:dnaJ homolog subfamily C member 15 n=1 Tax=Arvicola amphibius TaxID=1047088 RepID=UPI0018E3F2D7|nr:dnaJ homolog subfamily C member 15 [Arvicola amphibius]
MATGGGAAKEELRYAEYLPPSTQRPDADINHAAGRRLIVVGLGVAAVAFAGRYTLQIWKPLQQVITETARKISSPSLSSYYKGGFEPKMSRREASLILDVSQSAGKAKIQAAYNRMMRLNHPDRGGSGYLAQKIIEAKNLLLSFTKLK